MVDPFDNRPVPLGFCPRQPPPDCLLGPVDWLPLLLDCSRVLLGFSPIWELQDYCLDSPSAGYLDVPLSLDIAQSRVVPSEQVARNRRLHLRAAVWHCHQDSRQRNHMRSIVQIDWLLLDKGLDLEARSGELFFLRRHLG